MPAFCSDPLWVDVSNSSTFPNLTQCFQHTILSYIPFGFLILLFPLLMGQGERMRYRFAPLPWTILIIIRMLISFYLCLNSLFVFAMNTFVLDDTYTVDVIYPLVWAGFFALNVIIDLNRRRVGQVSSGIQHLAVVIMTICTVPEFHFRIVNQEPTVLFVAYMAFWPVVLIQCLLYCWADKRYFNEKTETSDELDSSFINRLTLWWFNRLPWIGARRDLKMEDLFELNYCSSSEHLAALFEKYWVPAMREYREKKMTLIKKDDDKSEPSAPSIVLALFRMFKFEFVTASVLKFISDTMLFANPFLLNVLIGFISDPNAPFWIGLSCAILMFVTSEIRSMLSNSYNYIMIRMGIKIQTTLSSIIYRKTLRLSSSSRREKTVGEITNLMAIDADYFQMTTQQIQLLWSCPYQIIFCLVYLFLTLGASAFPGLIVMIIFIPLNIFATIFIKRWKMQQMKLKDERVKMVNEVLNGIKVIKLYAWEAPMEEHISSIRNKELALIKRAAMVKNLLDTFNSASPFLVAASSFGTFILSSDANILTPQIAFVSLTLFNQLRSPMSMIAVLISTMVQAIVSNRRLKSFFVADEIEDIVIRNADANASMNAVELCDLTAVWDARDDSKPALHNINTIIPRGSFVSVVGTVGSGKSSLISAMLGELTIVRGEIIMTGSVAYVPQQSWIQNLSVRDNITFGKPFDRKFYDKVIFACALKPDFAILPHGDMTEIGEKGINLSGGQKARISLARAVYQQDDVYLLDDPLSAVDAHVGRHIFNHVFGPSGLLAQKTRVLITHGLTYARDTEEIFVMKDGSIVERGKFDHLLKLNGVFSRLMDEYAKIADDEEETNDEELHELLTTQESGDKSEQNESAESPEKTQSTDEDKKLIQKEGMEKGGVKFSVYVDYVRAANFFHFIAFLLFFVGFQVFQMMRSFWLSAWSNENDPAYTGEMMDQYARLGVYCGLGTIESISFLISLFFLLFSSLNASRHLHSPLIHNLMRSPISFYDTTPLGRILNRCSKDVDTIDTMLPLNFRYFLSSMLQLLATLIVILISTPLFIVVIIPLAIIYILFLRFYVPTSRQLKRLESVNRSPVFSHFGESIQGAASIRAYRKMSEFCLSSEEKLDAFIRCKYINIVSNRWIAVRLELVGNCVIFFSALFAILSKEWGWTSSAGVVGVSVSYAMSVTDVLNILIRLISALESNIVCVERVMEYTETPTEAEWEIDEKCPPASWPSQGVVRFENYSTRYRPGLDLVLKGINAEIKKGEKIGIVGRTGAGKSSFALALFRMIEPAGGVIRIDSLDTAQMGLHHLRKKLTIIPQDPVLFSGTLRFNLDPFGEYDDAALWTALQLAHLEAFTRTLAAGLDHVISEGGENISVGQRQLVCLARATLRNSKILVLDEATAAVDLQTDSLIQGTIRNHFKDCTVLTIAHRLNTILDYDRIMVLDQGQIAEMDTPAALMADKDSIFSRLLADAEADAK